MKLVFATHNKGKLREVKHFFNKNKNFEILGLDEIGFKEEIKETGKTLEENSLLKARTIYNKTGYNCIADDTGLEVEALDGKPGVNTARFAGEKTNHEKNMNKLLLIMKNINNRKAQFRSVLTLIKDGEEIQFEGVVKGKIAIEKEGKNGFGYDPIFIPEGRNKTYAEISNKEKLEKDHRIIALKKIVNFLGKNEIDKNV